MDGYPRARSGAEMKALDHLKMIRKLEKIRNIIVYIDNKPMRKSIATLMEMLEKTDNPKTRYDLYQYILLECNITKDVNETLVYAKMRYDEFHDLSSLTVYAGALMDVGLFKDGLYYSEKALDIAKKSNSLINFAAVSYVRESLKTKDAALIDFAINKLIESMRLYRTEDVTLEFDWIGTAIELGASSALISAVQSTK